MDIIIQFMDISLNYVFTLINDFLLIVPGLISLTRYS